MGADASWRAGRLCGVIGLACCLWAAAGGRAQAQVGQLLSPGRLAKAHTNLEGITNCRKCHEQGQKVTTQKCLVCHPAVAGRIVKKMGVHRNVTNDCVSCHAEHGGVEGELRPFDQKGFDHAAVARFPLTGKHAPLALQCAACHKERSFLTLSSSCVSCHADVHKGALGNTCATCHSTQVAFKEFGVGFDHSKTAFALTGAHRALACASCHVNKVFKGVKFASCADCHRDPHRPAFGTTCTACHTSGTWRTKKVDHGRTAFPLIGRHASVDCAACHKQAVMKVKPKADTCATCHVDVHRGAFRQDCKACHSESGFKKAPFDHSQTKFPLTAKHAGLTCESCHKTLVRGAARPSSTRVVDFGGLRTTCVSCHADVHQGTLGTACESCHTSTMFRVTTYTHTRVPEFFTGQHAPLTCGKCHVPPAPSRPVRTGTAVLNVTFKELPTACVSCHRDVHLGQEGPACENCHSIQKARFALENFSHAKTGFTLTGRHEPLPCVQCHKQETGVFPAGSGTAVRWKGVARECRACHTDVHLGQLEGVCVSCHKTDSFKVPGYTHRNRTMRGFMAGRHARAGCAACHKPVTGQFPAGRGIAIQFKVETRCVACHTDVHRGALGPNCGNCHRP